MLYVILEKARPYTRTRKGKLERVKGYVYPGGYKFLGMDEWYEKHKEELWGARKKRRGYQSMKETKKERAWFGKAFPGAEMAGSGSASFASSGGTVGRENWPPQPLLNYSAKKKLKKKSKSKGTEAAPFMGGGSGWVMS